MSRPQHASELKHIKAVGVVAAIASVTAALWTLANVIDGRQAIAIQNAVLAVAFFSAFIVNRRGRPVLSATMTACVFLAQMAFAIYAFGYRSGAHLFFLVGALVPYLMFPRARFIRAHVFAAISAVAFMACIIWQTALPVRQVIVSVSFMEAFNSLLVLAALIAVAISFVVIVSRSEEALATAHQQANDLLLNVLPETIAERLKAEPGAMIADRYDSVSVMFVDIVGFTAKVAAQRPEETVAMLNRLFTAFDEICERHGTEKIRTIGDGYLVVAGAPVGMSDHQVAIIDAGLAILKAAKDQAVDVRIGATCGELVAGVVGARRFQFDIWGDAVNVAARMEATGEAGKIQISEAMLPHLVERYSCIPRGAIPIKGKGDMKTWFVDANEPSVIPSA